MVNKEKKGILTAQRGELGKFYYFLVSGKQRGPTIISYGHMVLQRLQRKII